jgi:hypothetical protein
MAAWKCPKCRRSFTRKNQRHACGTGDRLDVLRGRSDALVRLYAALEAFVMSLGPVEVVARERYVLFRNTRIFTDLVIMSDALRAAVHLPRKVDDPLFFKVVDDGRKVTHVAKLRTDEELAAVVPYLKEAYAFSVTDSAARAGARTRK